MNILEWKLRRDIDVEIDIDITVAVTTTIAMVRREPHSLHNKGKQRRDEEIGLKSREEKQCTPHGN